MTSDHRNVLRAMTLTTGAAERRKKFWECVEETRTEAIALVKEHSGAPIKRSSPSKEEEQRTQDESIIDKRSN